VHKNEISELVVEVSATPCLKFQIQTKMCVLVIDDEVTLLEVLGILLENWGYEVLTAKSLKASNIIWSLHKTRISVVISDTWLGRGESTTELLNQFKQERPEVSILVTSGYLTELEATTHWDRGVINYLPKPFDPVQLLAALKQLS
jgi:DNA-binding NtrC family response regulator